MTRSMQRHDRRLPRAAVVSLVLLLIPTLAAGANPEQSTDRPLNVLPEIVVTAQKTEQTLEEVPASVSTLSGELARQSGAIGFPDLQAYTANISLRLTPTTSDFYIRGFGTASTNAGFEPSVGSVVDGVFYGRSNFLSAFFYDIDRIEVLRGPQGTLFGKNSTAGVVNLVSQAPRGVFGARAELLLADDGERSLRPVFNLPLGSDLATRLSGNFGRSEGLLYNTALDRREVDVAQDSVRLRARYAGEGPWSADFAVFSSTQTLNNNIFQLSQASDDMLAVIREYDADAEANVDFQNSANVPSRGEIDFEGSSIELTGGLDGWWNTDELTFTSITAWARQITHQRDIDADFSAAPVIRDSLLKPSPFTQISQEFRFAGQHPSFFGWGYGLQFVIGAYAYESRLTASDVFQLEDLGAAFAYLTAAQAGQADGLPPGLAGGIAGQLAGPLSTLLQLLAPANIPVIGGDQTAQVLLDQRSRALALFGQLEQRFTEDWAFIAGLRLGQERKTGFAQSRSDSLLIKQIAGQSDHDSSLSRNESEVSPKLGLKWEWSPGANVYATWSRGFKSGGFNALPLNAENLQFEPERASSYEMGAKTRLLQGSMRVSASIFDTYFDNLQVSTFRDANFIILNAARARSRGFEADINWLTPVPGVALYSSLGFVDARYLSYPNAPAPADSDQKTQDLGGKRLAVSPRWSAAFVPSFTTQLPFLETLATFAVDVLYRSDRYLDVDLDERTRQPATTEINARMTLGAYSGRWALNLTARNLTEEVILEQVLDQPLAPGNFAAIRSDRGRVFSANLVLEL